VPRTAARFGPGLTPETQEPRPGPLFGGRAAAHRLQAAIRGSCEPGARSVAAFRRSPELHLPGSAPEGGRRLLRLGCALVSGF